MADPKNTTQAADSSTKPKRESRNLTFTPVSRAEKTMDHREMEALAQEVAREFKTQCRKIRALRPHIQRIQDYFSSSVRGSITLAGCSSFKEFCEKKLGRSKQAVYSMLGEYPEKRKEKKQRQPKRQREYEDGLSEEDVMRMRTGLNAVVRAKEAERNNSREEAEAAWVEFQKIAEVEPLRSTLAGDRPNYKVMLIDLVRAVEQVVAAHEQLLSTLEAIPPSVLPQEIVSRNRSCLDKARKISQAYRMRLRDR